MLQKAIAAALGQGREGINQTGSYGVSCMLSADRVERQS
jgi:hypothetical protein